MYPTEEIARRNRWQDEYDTATREHAWHAESNPTSHYGMFSEDDEIPADVAAEFEAEW